MTGELAVALGGTGLGLVGWALFDPSSPLRLLVLGGWRRVDRRRQLPRRANLARGMQAAFIDAVNREEWRWRQEALDRARAEGLYRGRMPRPPMPPPGGPNYLIRGPVVGPNRKDFSRRGALHGYASTVTDARALRLRRKALPDYWYDVEVREAREAGVGPRPPRPAPAPAPARKAGCGRPDPPSPGPESPLGPMVLDAARDVAAKIRGLRFLASIDVPGSVRTADDERMLRGWRSRDEQYCRNLAGMASGVGVMSAADLAAFDEVLDEFGIERKGSEDGR